MLLAGPCRKLYLIVPIHRRDYYRTYHKHVIVNLMLFVKEMFYP